MKVYTSESASTVICPNVARSCAGDRCAAWSEIGDKGFCGMVSHHEIVKSMSDQIPSIKATRAEESHLENPFKSETNTDSAAVSTEQNNVNQHRKAGRPSNK